MSASNKRSTVWGKMAPQQKTAPAVVEHRKPGASPSQSFQGVVMTGNQSTQPTLIREYLTPEFLAQAMGLPVEYVAEKLASDDEKEAA